MLVTKRVYEPYDAKDGTRLLVERLWPRGIKKEALHLDGWLKEVAPSGSLRRWFNHDPDKWNEFIERYYIELNQHPEVWQPILTSAKHGRVTLLYSARDEVHNNAVALKAFLDEKAT
jgi:uncharacterized protein YeaO (DUF488 family)